jgi:small subunit ribosomal protein S12
MTSFIQNTKKTKSERLKKKKKRSTALKGCPQKRGICMLVTIKKPKKPNSAIRKIAKVILLTTKRKITSYICGWSHNLQKHSMVLIRGGRVRDLPGVHYKCIKGALDFHWKEMIIRRQSRSKYGAPHYKKRAIFG